MPGESRPGRASTASDGDLLWGEFSGGHARRGSLAGTCAPDGTLDFAYCMVLDGGEVISGRCHSTPTVLADGRIRLHEEWERYGRTPAAGASPPWRNWPRHTQSARHKVRRKHDRATDRAMPGRADGRKKGGVVTWACAPGFPPAVIFPFTPPERMGTRNVIEFQALMYRTLYYFGNSGKPEVDYDLSIGEEPEWSEDGLTATITVKPWKWSNGETLCADNVLFWVNLMKVKGARYGEYVPGYFPDNCVELRQARRGQGVLHLRQGLLQALDAVQPVQHHHPAAQGLGPDRRRPGQRLRRPRRRRGGL